MRATHAERVKYQRTRNSPTGEIQSITLVGFNDHDGASLRNADQGGGSLRRDGEFCDKACEEYD
jgi:hypothetical protein